MPTWQCTGNHVITYALTVENASRQLQRCTRTNLYIKRRLHLRVTFVGKVSKVKKGCHSINTGIQVQDYCVFKFCIYVCTLIPQCLECNINVLCILGLKPFVCDRCGHAFPDKGGLSKHRKTVHAVLKKFSCPACGKTCAR